MRHTIAEYREVFGVIPAEDRRRVIGLNWEMLGDRWIKLTPVSFADHLYACCPIGALLFKRMDAMQLDPKRLAMRHYPRLPNAGDVNAWLADVDIEAEVQPVSVITDFMSDWDHGKMSVADMEAIFA